MGIEWGYTWGKRNVGRSQAMLDIEYKRIVIPVPSTRPDTRYSRVLDREISHLGRLAT